MDFCSVITIVHNLLKKSSQNSVSVGRLEVKTSVKRLVLSLDPSGSKDLTWQEFQSFVSAAGKAR